ncbi:PqqD family protein [Monashia sp. NPDC004114]
MSPAFRAAKGVGVVVPADGEHVYLAQLPDGPLLVLDGVAATIWTEATTGPEQGWVGRVATAFDQTEDDIDADVRRFIADLEARGMVEPATGQPAGSHDASR